MSPMLKDAEKSGIRALRKKRDPSSILPHDFFAESDDLRREFAKLTNVPDPTRIVIIPSTSYALSIVANNVKVSRGDTIIVIGEEFPSNYYPWQRLAQESGATLKVIAPPDVQSGRGRKWNENILESIDATTKVVAMGNVHWADGTLFHLVEIRKRTLEVGALLIVDGTQSVGALPFDVGIIKPDALICAAYKWLLGPYSIGLAYFGEHFDGGRPIEESWMNRLNSEDFTSLVNYESGYQPGALRYEVGEHSNFIHVSMLLKSLQQINRWGVSNIQEYCRTITDQATMTLTEKGYWIEEAEYRGAHLFGIRIPEKDIQLIRQSFSRHKIFVSFRGNAIRVAPNVYNDGRDLSRLAKVLTR
ncbi:MAG TPA: aminotransferase class V-fold PLP-dependent enzyme [Chryseolinea sp.]|nr:aminotransferase class V-fold PLP-dependent enzyme [Chryseolinea sp.]